MRSSDRKLRLPQGLARRQAIALLGVAALVAGLVPALAAASSRTEAPAPAEPEDKIASAVAAELDRGGEADFWIRLDAEADTSGARQVKDWTARGQQVVDALQATAQDSQAEVRRLLDVQGVAYTSFWITNAIRVENATKTVAHEVAELESVAEIRAPQVYKQPDPVESEPADVSPNAVEWGLANINADDVWDQYGVRGEDIVVANIDTGVQFDHPALVASYRGNNGDGTFDHDYNWFDTSGACDGAPCDTNSSSHGTHTMGTMVGDDGDGNQIGVAPGVRWITANGCATCSEVDLVESAQWMLAPTDSAGVNPDVSKRPHIVNNSWGTTTPSNDPMMEDILENWAASGIFGVWANGNNGPECETSGAPGSRILNYSVGAYDPANSIADFSSRGHGQDGETKPNISAPGVLIRSSVTGSSYNRLAGTSMATPHVSGAIALLWSAQPDLRGDIESTRLLLDFSAVDTPDDQCGGDATDNNVYGEGRLDALALVELGSGGIGTLAGTVTDAETEEPVEGAAVSVTGPIDREVRTGADGTYSLVLLPGDYDVTIGGIFGYDDAADSVHVTATETTAHDAQLAPTPRVSVSGVVTDGSGQGWPLYAEVTASHESGYQLTRFTDPETGSYRLDLAQDSEWTLRVAAVSLGYQVAERQLTVESSDLTEDIELTVTLDCTAPGYEVSLDGASQAFDKKGSGKRPPRGWRVVDTDHDYPGYEHRPGWVFDNPGERDNDTGGTGGFAIVDSDHAGQHHVQDTQLISPTIDMSDHQTPAVEFVGDLEPAANSTAMVDVSADAGRTWTTVWRNAGFPGAPGPSLQVAQVPQAAGEPHVKVRFHYTGQWSGWWAIDEVFIGNRACEPVDGGLVVGGVTDTVTGDGINGATVASVADPDQSAVTVATPDDPGLGDGVYWLFSPAVDEQQFTAAANGYTTQTGTTTVTTGQATALDFALDPAGPAIAQGDPRLASAAPR